MPGTPLLTAPESTRRPAAPSARLAAFTLLGLLLSLLASVAVAGAATAAPTADAPATRMVNDTVAVPNPTFRLGTASWLRLGGPRVKLVHSAAGRTDRHAALLVAAPGRRGELRPRKGALRAAYAGQLTASVWVKPRRAAVVGLVVSTVGNGTLIRTARTLPAGTWSRLTATSQKAASKNAQLQLSVTTTASRFGSRVLVDDVSLNVLHAVTVDPSDDGSDPIDVPDPTTTPVPTPVVPAPVVPTPTTPAPVVPAPTTPTPTTPAPVVPAPTTPAPTTPAPVVPAPTTPAPTTPAPVVPAPTTPAPTTPAPTVPAPTTPAPTTHDWKSGASGDGVANGGFAQWRGNDVEIAGTWNDSYEAQQNQWSIDRGAEYGSWTKDLDVAIGGIYKDRGDTWAQAGNGAYDARWRSVMTTLKNKWVGHQGTMYIRFAHEFNGNWYKWSVSGSEAADFVKAWKRFRAVQQEVFPASKLVFCPNSVTSRQADGSMWDWRTAFPGAAYVDLLSVDYYNQYNLINTEAGFNSWLNKTDPTGAPWGLDAHRNFALAQGLPFALSEWSSNADQGDAPVWIASLHRWLGQHGGTGPGEVVYEIQFNVSAGFAQFQFFPSTNQPSASQTYRDLF